MDTRAARDLLTSRTAVIGDLAVTYAEHAQLEAGLTGAHDRGRQLVEAATPKQTVSSPRPTTSSPPASSATTTPTLLP